MKHYLQDGAKAAQNRDSTSVIPPPKAASGSESCLLRTCQWNIHYLYAPWLRETAEEISMLSHAENVANAILGVNADVIVLNEFDYSGRSPEATGLERLCVRLENAGYAIYDLCECSFPTAIASRLPVISSAAFPLDTTRAAVQVTVNAGSSNTNVPITIFGTHLEDSDRGNGKYRLDEAKELLANVESTTDSNDPVLIVGDLNQQRSVDYTTEEWKVICDNKSQRSSLQSDGVSTLLTSAGFTCCYDQVNANTACNWRPGVSPPPTHWSSTVIDYAYSRKVKLVGIHILPYNLSDHRMVVSDWLVR